MTEELKVVLRRSEHSGFGFSLLGTTGPPHVIYDIVENSPAADCGVVEAGDIILKINGIDVHCYTTKEVLKCLRLSDDLITLELKRDPELKAHIKEQLANSRSPHYAEIEAENIYNYKFTTNRSPTHSSPSSSSNLNVDVGTTSPLSLRYAKSPTTNLPQLQNPPSTSTAVTRHSRSSSASSFKTQIETNASNTAAVSPTASGRSTSPTCRPSRIPTALKSPLKPTGVHNSPQHKRPRPSQIPTKAVPLAAGYVSSSYSQSGAHAQQHEQYNQQEQYFQQELKQRDVEPNPITPPQPVKGPRFEAYMMTGDLMLNLSRTQQSNLLPAHAKKVDSLRDSPKRVRANGALAPCATGESSPTSSSSMEYTISTDAGNLQNQNKTRTRQSQKPVLQQQQPKQKHQQDQRSSNVKNNENYAGFERQYYTHLVTTDTLLLCEEQEKDMEYDDKTEEDNIHGQQRHQAEKRCYIRHREKYAHHQVEKEGDSDQNRKDQLKEERIDKNQTHYDIVNSETYCDDSADESSERQCLVMHHDKKDEKEKQRPRPSKQQRTMLRYKIPGDSVDFARSHSHNLCGTRGSGSSSSSATVKSDGVSTSQEETSFSVPNSPISLSTCLVERDTANSVPTSPESSCIGAVGNGNNVKTTQESACRHNGIVRKCDSAGFRTSKSEDHLQQIQREGNTAVIPIDIDEDVNSSLNTLLDTRQDSEESQVSNPERIVWTYNAPLPSHLHQQQQQQYVTHYGHNSSSNTQYHSHSHSHSHSSSLSSSPQHSSGSPTSPTSVSSSVMSSSGSKSALGNGGTPATNSNDHQQQQQHQQSTTGVMYGTGTATGVMTSTTSGLLQCPVNNGGGAGGSVSVGTAADQSVSEAISNISSPDYQDDEYLLSSRDFLGGMVLSDHSDSDSTILVSDAAIQRQKQQEQQKLQQSEHKVVIQVRGIDSSNAASPRSAYSELKDSEDELTTLTEEQPTAQLATAGSGGEGYIEGRDYSPPISDDGSDAESLHSYHYSPKGVDLPSAIRLAKRLYSLDGFKKSDVSRHLSKNNDFSRVVADEYLKYFNFEKKTLEQALREFLRKFALSGETQERERVLLHFSKRFLDCNPGTFNSQDAVHTLTCAIMLLNTDLHGQNIGRKMSCVEFIENLAELNDGENFPKDVLKSLYQAIKSQPLEWALDDEVGDMQKPRLNNNSNASAGGFVNQVPFLNMPESSSAVEYKKGYVMRKCCYDSNYKKTPFGKRSWKMFYCTLRDLVLYLHKDEHGFRKCQMSDNLHNAIRIHHALATKATDYAKKQHVFRLQTADQAEYLFQTSDSKELQSWVETINFVCAAYSAPPLEGGVGSQKRFQRPLLPSTHTKLLLKEQIAMHEQQLVQLENALLEHKKGPVPSKGLALQNYKEKESYLTYELGRYKAYVSILSAKLIADHQQLIERQQEGQSLANEEESDTFPLADGGVVRSQPQQQVQTSSIITSMKQQKQHQTQLSETRYPNQPNLG